jgi:uncharacterized protein YndB with AHSA1/START domain
VSAAFATLRFERRFRSAPEVVFAAYADVGVRSGWAAPTETAAIAYTAADFCVDGVDAFRCGEADDLRFTGIVRYLDILHGQRIVYSEVISTAEQRLCASVVTWELSADGLGTRLALAVQVTSFVGEEMIDGSRNGMNGALDRLVEMVDRSKTD